ncbi:terminase large subunit [Paracoccus sulfuroxidans]|nr:terminase TerL endonuclease subunit [Paracoccus sulfuroxidans]
MCRIPEGAHQGKPVRLLAFQKEFILAVYDNKNVTRTAILSMGRKNGKTAITAMLLLLHLCGPESVQGGQLYSTAQSREQASVVFRLAAKMIYMSPRLNAFVTVKESTKEMACPRRGTRYLALSKESKTALGLSPVFSVHDELGQVRGPRSDLYDAVETGSGAHANPLSIIISTQAAQDGDLLSELIDKAGEDPHTVCHLYTAPPEMDPFSESALRAANPAFGIFQNEKETQATADNAKRMPSFQASFRNLILNQRIEINSPFIAKPIWDENAATPDPIDGAEIYGGLDLSEVSDLTAFVAAYRTPGSQDDRLNILPTFWLPQEGLSEKARKEKVPYDLWAEQGHLQAVPGRVIDYDFVAHYLWDLSSRCVIRKIAFDRYNFRHLKKSLLDVGFTEAFIEEHFVPFGQGFVSMSPALRTTETMILQNQIKHGNHPLLTMCMANAIVVRDPAGNRKLTKSTSTRKIDGAVALAMSIGTLQEGGGEPSKKSYLEGAGLLVL